MIQCEGRIPTRKTLFNDYGALCTRACKRFIRPGLDKADLYQIAAIGLIKACDRYDAGAATPFEPFAWLFIIGELMHFVRDHERLVRAPRQVRKMEKRVHEAQEVLVARLQREPSIIELSQYLGVNQQLVADACACRDRAVAESLDALAPHELRLRTETTEEPETALLIQEALSTLTGTERAIVLALYAGGYSQLELADRLGYSRRHISRLHRRALRKMRTAVTA